MQQELTYDEWLEELIECFLVQATMTEDEAREYVLNAEWDMYFSEGYRPQDACREDMSYWD